ncbi:hypothetical protein [Pseudomonas sp. PDM09]|uniref:hypothetical protein n=1 Tax=Pseudomonas sp. PDM09 TaxID=2769270 RepID=UPI00177AFD8A|nr:hypothetical protein [Pseudomonas sp. PDM09]MBD9563234.1 hypothetical protein [Pseudomonas sp. PDM09]
MTVHKLESEDSHHITQDLSTVINFATDLPAMVFRASDFEFCFFERSLVSFSDVLIELISASYEDFSSDVFIRFGGSSENTCFLLDGVDVEGDVEFINKGFRDFFAGEVDYPMVIGDLEFDWLAFESAHEEFGVLAVKSGLNVSSFSKMLKKNFISSRAFQKLAGQHEVMNKIVKAFHGYF